MSEVTRSMEATGTGAAARVSRQRRAMSSGWWGMLLLLATELTLFGCLIASYFYLRFQAATWPPAGIEPPSVTLPLVLTAALVLSAVPVFGAVRAAQGGRRWAAWRFIALALVIQAAYLGLQIHLFVDDINSFSPAATAYGSIYFVLLGVHHTHVAVGLLLDVWLLGVLALGLTNYRLIAIRVIAIYWYFVAAMGVLVVLTQLYPSL
jgi:heme/copper-type cytochrome/quinol oxidase subunit 3